MSSPKLSNAGANAAADAACALLNSGYLRLYSGTKPASADTALSGNTLLAELRFGATAFAASSGGVATANSITPDSAADATGTASFFRALKSDGTTAIFDGDVGTSGTDCVIATTSIVANAIIAVSSCTYTQQKG